MGHHYKGPLMSKGCLMVNATTRGLETMGIMGKIWLSKRTAKQVFVDIRL